ncbi:hypothetical protein [Saccharibacillus deserti]|uniref:hypothetical protein n=1 Tax=Saccharibacillus deserti TaxID=1634444 RepID=UPI00155192EA|nr:hypothetical protein [Saccharibacillus deserti]
MFQFNEYYKTRFEDERYASYKQSSLKAFSVAFDPASTRSELTDALMQTDAFPPYDLYWTYGDVGVDRILFEIELQLHLYTEFGSDPGLWSEATADQLMNEIALIRDRLYPFFMEAGGSEEVWRCFMDYLQLAAEFEDRRSGRSELLKQTFQYRTDVLNRVHLGQLSQAQTAGFDAAVEKLEALLAASDAPEAIQTAFQQVKPAYEALPSSGSPGSALAADIEAARKLLDLPKGIRSGQYPASAFGALRRAINEAQRTLEKGGTDAQLAQAQSKLAAAVKEFRGRQKP